MSWLALTPAEFLALWSVAAAVAVWLYLLHRRPRHKRVSTLRFWQSLEPSALPSRRRKIREPWPLVAQLLFLLLAILALANPRWGGRLSAARFLVLLVDTSVWSQMQPPGEMPWMERIQQEAAGFLDRLAPGDQVLLLRAEADAAPVLPFTSDRAALRRALTALRPSDTVADLPRALEKARSALAGRSRAAVVYVGPGMVDESQARRLAEVRRAFEPSDAGPRPQLVVRLVGASAPLRNTGITRLALRRDPARPDHWHLLVQIKNYGDRAVPARLRLSIGGHLLQEQAVSLAAEQGVGARAEFTWADGGELRAELSPSDALASDNRAVAYLPGFRPVRIAVFTDEPQALRPVLSANPYWRTEFVPPWGTPAIRPDVAIYDAVTPAAGQALTATGPAANSILFLRGGSARQMRLTAWNPQHPVTRWIRTRDISVRSVVSAPAGPSDAVLAWADGAPVMLARAGAGRKALLLGFDPRQSNFPLQPAFPLLMAGAIEWMTGAVEETADPIATGEVLVAAPAGPAGRVFSPRGVELPFARSGERLHLLAFQAGLYRVTAPEGERKLAAHIPPLPSRRWRAGTAESSVLEARAFADQGRELWRWLLLLAILPLWAEWWLCYPKRRGAAPQEPPSENRRGK